MVASKGRTSAEQTPFPLEPIDLDLYGCEKWCAVLPVYSSEGVATTKPSGILNKSVFPVTSQTATDAMPRLWEPPAPTSYSVPTDRKT